MRQRWRKGQEDGGKGGKRKEKRENGTDRKQDRVNICLFFARWSFIPAFKVHTRTIRQAGTIIAIPLFLPT